MDTRDQSELIIDMLAGLGAVLLIVLVHASGHTALAVVITIAGTFTGIVYVKNNKRVQNGD
jgi:hypothetical protein